MSDGLAAEHAKLFTVRGRQILAYLDLDEDNDNLLVIVLRLWMPDVGPATLTIGLPKEASEKAREIWDDATASAFPQLDADRVERLLTENGALDLLRVLAPDTAA